MYETPWEGTLLERKSRSDLNDLLKTFVAFANSVRPDEKATILIGELDDGMAQGVENTDNILRTVRREAEKIYPPIRYRADPYKKDGVDCVRVEIEYSGDTPHFGGVSWVRQGSATIKAPDEVFQRLIDYRTGKVRELARCLDQIVSFKKMNVHRSSWLDHGRGNFEGRLVFVNSFWATFEYGEEKKHYSEPLTNLTLSWDNKNNRLTVIVQAENYYPSQ